MTTRYQYAIERSTYQRMEGGVIFKKATGLAAVLLLRVEEDDMTEYCFVGTQEPSHSGVSTNATVVSKSSSI